MAKDKKGQHSAWDPCDHTMQLSALRDSLTIYGKPVFSTLEIDANTGDISYTLNKEIESELNKTAGDIKVMQLPGAPQKIIEIIEGVIKSKPDYETFKSWQDTFNAIYNDTQRGQELFEELIELRPYINNELKKADYKIIDEEGNAIIDFYYYVNKYTLGELLDLLADPSSAFARLLNAARKARNTNKQQAGRAARHEIKKAAEAAGVDVTTLKGGNYFLFSNFDLWPAFSNARICKIGTLDSNYIDKETGRITKPVDIKSGEIEPITAADISIAALILLASISGNSVDNVREEFIKTGSITFYVKGVLKDITDDPRTLHDNQLNLDRKTAGVLYLEKKLQPLEDYVAQMPDGSRYKIFNYFGYDANTDTMTIQAPYIYMLWKRTQDEYFKRQEELESFKTEKKKLSNQDQRKLTAPPKINKLFKGKFITIDETILEIAIYITNIMLAQGSGESKQTEITYKKIINECPRLKQKIEDIESRPNTEILPDGRKRNNTALYNTELRKIKRAFDIILDPALCDAASEFNNLQFEPSKYNKSGKLELIAPTKKMINEKIKISWDRPIKHD